MLDALRAEGWSVAVHNDYRQGPEKTRMTFWLLTHESGVWCKGEGATDEDALAQARAQAVERLKLSLPKAAADDRLIREFLSLPPKGAGPGPVVGGVSAQAASLHGLPEDCRKWRERQWLAWFGAVVGALVPGSGPPVVRASMAERTCMRRLVAWLKPLEARAFLEYAVGHWDQLRAAHGITTQVPHVRVMFGFREALVASMRLGVDGTCAKLSRTHRSRGPTEGLKKKAVGW
jgi:hypothetical protein